MGFLDKAKAAAEQAATRAKEGVEEVQTKRNLSHAYEELGRTAFDLINEGQISHDRMTGLADEIRKLQESVPAETAEPVGASAAASSPSADDSSASA
jgi:chemotaxis regulatin CheY-phosphate phosphatase CheZ